MPPRVGGEQSVSSAAGRIGLSGSAAHVPIGAHGQQARVQVEVAIAAHLGSARRHGIEAYVEHRARRGECVGVVWTGPEGTQLRCVGASEGKRADATALGGANLSALTGDDVGLSLARLAPRQNWAAAILEGEIACQRLVIGGTPVDGNEDVDLLAMAPGAVLLCEGTEAGQLAAYRALKKHQVWLAETPVVLFVLDAVDAADGAATGRRIVQLAERFLGMAPQYAGCTVRAASLRQVLAAQDILPASGFEDRSRWLDIVRDVISRIGGPPRAEVCSEVIGPDGAGVAPGLGPAVEIDFAIPVEAPLRRVEQIEELVAGYLSSFCPQATGCERIDTSRDGRSAILKANSGDGGVRCIVVAVSESPGLMERLTAAVEPFADGGEICWIGVPPNESQVLVARRLGLQLHVITLRYVSVEGRLGVLVETRDRGHH